MKKQLEILSSSSRELKSLSTLTTLSLLMALNIVMSQTLSIKIGSEFSIGIGFLAIATAAYLYGPIAGGITAALCDVIKAIFFPFGPFFPGWTLSAFIGGFIYGMFFYKRDVKLRHCIFAKVLIAIIVNILLNALWIHLTYGSPYFPLLSARIVKNVVSTPLEIGILYGFIKFVLVPLKRNLPQVRSTFNSKNVS